MQRLSRLSILLRSTTRISTHASKTFTMNYKRYTTAPISDPAQDVSNLQSTGNVSTDAKLEPGDGLMKHPSWLGFVPTDVQVTHIPPTTLLDKLAYWTIKTIRFNFDVLTGYKFFKRTEETWLTRIIFLETIAAVPGSIGGTLRHLSSLRRLQRDHGWIHTLLEEAENERMHLLTALELKQPGKLMRFFVLGAQGVFYNYFFLCYLISPKYCHKMVGYIEEEAVRTYEKLLHDIDDGPLSGWKTQPAPLIARNYWQLKPDATVRDVFYMIRADEAHHRDVNHILAGLKVNDVNPFSLKH